ncbi:MAG: hypothetical protein A3J37_09140 [Alphaproteobacteria bacterium RIFCSPHIGHO2_12_FULL_45_9]|nr:MAG: hypothetical protein A3B66_00560 [Alphaproteobacteria bacterium RIFCSPHIGHO2_02_FULL_46_13]OFW94810.1 MAG: hypothetical protein A3J37_09140 [Alphaproteobacteria bacterium RIFCSPHIGHO2_12_FULL_45_9]
MKKSIFAAIFVAPLLMLAGCVSLTQGNEQTITFNLQPKEIQCVASRNNVDISSITYQYNTLSVSKSKSDIVVQCAAPGYKRKIIRLRSETQAAGVVGGVFLDYGVTDMATGAMWRYPDEATIILQKE